MITQEYLKECLHYDPLTGVFTRLERPVSHFDSAGRAAFVNGRYAGKVAGTIGHHHSGNRYIKIGISGRLGSAKLRVHSLAHRLAWLYMYGSTPSQQIDHINGDGTDNRAANLRDVSAADNSKNMRKPKTNTSGVVGVSWSKLHNRWEAQIRAGGVREFLGLFDHLEEAATARARAEIKYGFHPNHGR